MRASKKFFFWTIFIISAISILGNLGSSERGDFFNPFIGSETKGAQTTPLGNIVSNALKGAEGKYGIFIKNLKTGENFSLNADQGFKPGSLYKLKLMVLVFKQIKEGKLLEDEILVVDIKDLNDFFYIPEEETEFSEGQIDFTIKSALEQMIVISHNYAALALTKKIRANNLASDTTPKEIATFFEDLYNGRIIDSEYSKRMLELLERQKINDRIPKYLPEETKIAHKTGDIDFFEHDGGIIFSSKGDYIFVVLTETKMSDAAGEKIAEISKSVFEYFNKER